MPQTLPPATAHPRLKKQIPISNRRSVGLVESPQFGTVAIVEVGATCVGGIEHTFVPGEPVAKGAERGYFRFGGSSLITRFEPGRLELAADLLEHTGAGRELYARMGDRLGGIPGSAQ